MDGKYCKWTVRDFEGVRTIEGSAGEIDKTSDPMLTHMSDSVGYFMHKEYPIGGYYNRSAILDAIGRPIQHEHEHLKAAWKKKMTDFEIVLERGYRLVDLCDRLTKTINTHFKDRSLRRRIINQIMIEVEWKE